MRSPRTRRSAIALIAAAAVAAAGLAAVATAATTKRLTADKTKLKFSTTKLTVPAGKVTLKMTNRSESIPHNIALRGNGVNKKGAVVTDAVSKVTATVKKGKTYTFYCSVPGHEPAGMRGKLTVK